MYPDPPFFPRPLHLNRPPRRHIIHSVSSVFFLGGSSSVPACISCSCCMKCVDFDLFKNRLLSAALCFGVPVLNSITSFGALGFLFLSFAQLFRSGTLGYSCQSFFGRISPIKSEVLRGQRFQVLTAFPVSRTHPAYYPRTAMMSNKSSKEEGGLGLFSQILYLPLPHVAGSM